MSIEDFRKERIKKLQKLRDAGVDAYPATTARTHTIQAVQAQFDQLSTSVTPVTLAGRVMAQRGHGGLTFLDLDDGSATLQALVGADRIGQEVYDFFISVIDVGDVIEVSGTLALTKRGERSLEVRDWKMLTKSIRPLPEKWHGLQDMDERFRKRYIDLLMHPELREMFRRKAHFWEVTRNFMKERGFLETETPTLEITTGGAEARPFKTHHNDFDIDVFLRISVGELWQKRLMAAGFPKTFEIGRAWRNEGTSPEHLQEFTNMEFYWAYADYAQGMQLVQELYQAIAREVFGTTVFTTRGHTFDLAGDFRRIEYVDEIKQQTGVDVLNASEKEMKAKLNELGISYEGENRERLTDTLWKHCRKSISGPAFLVHHPKLVSPLAKESSERPGTVERFQVLLAGSEIGNGYSELNDPIDQKARFDLQKELIANGDQEAMMPDDEFVEMLEYGMPPTCGFGFGERLFAFLVDKPLRETQLFPLMKPKEE
jgi:lysyl-tRNA synthetase class 2